MILNTLIVSIALALIMALALGLKMWLDPDEKENGDIDQAGASKAGNSACGTCGLKNIASCVLDDKSHTPAWTK